MADVAASPLRVGLIGLGRPGLHLMERFAVGGPFRVVAVCAEPSVTAIVSSFGARLVRHPRDLLAAADVDVVWFAEHDAFRNSFAAADAVCEKHTIVETPLALSAVIAERAFQEAAHRGRLLLVSQPRRFDSDFQQALIGAQDQAHGTIRGAKFVAWTYGLPPCGAARGRGPRPLDASYDARIAKLRLAAHALDQLVPLVSDRPIRVVAAGDHNVPGFPDLLAGFLLSLPITV